MKLLDEMHYSGLVLPLLLVDLQKLPSDLLHLVLAPKKVVGKKVIDDVVGIVEDESVHCLNVQLASRLLNQRHELVIIELVRDFGFEIEDLFHEFQGLEVVHFEEVGPVQEVVYDVCLLETISTLHHVYLDLLEHGEDLLIVEATQTFAEEVLARPLLKSLHFYSSFGKPIVHQEELALLFPLRLIFLSQILLEFELILEVIELLLLSELHSSLDFLKGLELLFVSLSFLSGLLWSRRVLEDEFLSLRVDFDSSEVRLD